MATITDVSKKAGVSRSTVSRLIAGKGYVSDEARKAVEAAIEELGYRPNTMARGLRCEYTAWRRRSCSRLRFGRPVSAS